MHEATKPIKIIQKSTNNNKWQPKDLVKIKGNRKRAKKGQSDFQQKKNSVHKHITSDYMLNCRQFPKVVRIIAAYIHKAMAMAIKSNTYSVTWRSIILPFVQT